MTSKAAKAKKDQVFTGGFSSFSVKEIAAAKEFYSKTLGLKVLETPEGLSIDVPSDGGSLFLYPKDNHKPATFTVFNLMVDRVQNAVDELTERGIKFLQYDKPMKTDRKGIFWGGEEGNGPNIAWFEDPSGNIISVIEVK